MEHPIHRVCDVEVIGTYQLRVLERVRSGQETFLTIEEARQRLLGG